MVGAWCTASSLYDQWLDAAFQKHIEGKAHLQVVQVQLVPFKAIPVLKLL